MTLAKKPLDPVFLFDYVLLMIMPTEIRVLAYMWVLNISWSCLFDSDFAAKGVIALGGPAYAVFSLPCYCLETQPEISKTNSLD